MYTLNHPRSSDGLLVACLSLSVCFCVLTWTIQCSNAKAVYTLTILPDAGTVRERFASGYPCTHCVHCVGFVRDTETTSGCVRSGRERFASALLCCVNARVDTSGKERRTVCPCLLTDVFISTDTIHMTRKGNICHELSTCNWVTTGRKADAVCTQRSGHVPFASGQSFVVWMQTRR